MQVADQRHERARRLGEPGRDLVLGVALPQEGVGDQAPVGRRELRHRHPEQPGDLEDAVVGNAGVAQLPHAASRPRRRARCRRRASSPAAARPRDRHWRSQELLVDPGPLGDLAPRSGAPRRRASTRSTGSSASRSSSTALRSSSSETPSSASSREQPQAGLARLALETVEQPLGLEVDLGHLGAHSAWPGPTGVLDFADGRGRGRAADLRASAGAAAGRAAAAAHLRGALQADDRPLPRPTRSRSGSSFATRRAARGGSAARRG